MLSLPSALFWRCRAGGLGAAEGFEAEEQADAEDEAEPVKALQADGRLRGVQPGRAHDDGVERARYQPQDQG